MDWWQLTVGIAWVVVGLGLIGSSRQNTRATQRRRRLGQASGAALVVIGLVGLVVTLATG